MKLSYILLYIIFSMVCGCKKSSTGPLDSVGGNTNDVECDYVFSGSWNIYENPKYCITPDRLVTDDESLATDCVWYVENNCDSEKDVGCSVAPDDLISRQDLCEIYQCSAGSRLLESANSKYNWSYFEVCKIAIENI